ILGAGTFALGAPELESRGHVVLLPRVPVLHRPRSAAWGCFPRRKTWVYHELSASLSPKSMGKSRDLVAGSILGRYELVLRVASGGMGEIWAARLKGSRGFQKLVAVKTLLPELSHDPSFEQMFLDEAALAARIKHPNVVHVIDLGEQDQLLYQVMEWVNGESLWSLVRVGAKRGPMPLVVAARIVTQA